MKINLVKVWLLAFPALTLLLTTGNTQSLDSLRIKTEADSLCAVADSFRVALQNKKAIAEYEEAHKKYQQLGEWQSEYKMLRWISACYRHLCDYQKMLTIEEKKLELSRAHDSHSGVSQSLQNLGICYCALSNYPRALTYLGQSLKLCRDLGDRQREADVEGVIGIVYAELYDSPKALEYLQDWLNLSKKINNPWGENAALYSLSGVYNNLGDYQKAADCYQQCIDTGRRLTENSAPHLLKERGGFLECESLLGLGSVYLKTSDYSKALDCLQRSMELSILYEDRIIQIESLVNMGLVHSALGKYRTALEKLDRALALAQDVKTWHMIKLCYSALGECYAVQHLDSLAVMNYQKAIETVEKIRSNLDVEAQKSSFAAGIAETYEAIVLTLLKLNRPAEAYNYIERCRARSFLDLLASGKVTVGKSRHEEFLRQENEFQREKAQIEEQISGAAEDSNKVALLRGKLESDWSSINSLVEAKKRFEPELASLVTVNSLTLPEVQQLLDKKSTILEYFLTKEKTLIWLIAKDQFEVFQVPIGSDSLKSLVKGWRDAIIMTGHEEYLSQDLYKILIAPVIEKISTEKLIIIPHGVLHYLPFQALQDARGAYLLDRGRISYLPSASVLKFLKSKRHTKAVKLLALGNPSTDREGYSTLPLAEQEVKEIAGFYPQSQVLIGKEATEDKFRELAPNYDILHLACHSELNSAYPLYSGLLLAPGGEEDGELDVHELFTMDINAYLVVLSACQTGLGHLTNGDELVGLSRAFIYAGTPSVLSSLWMVEDESTAYLMKQFYQNLKTYNKAESLRRAQLRTREKYPNPYSWAGFVLIGDDQ